MGSSWTRARTCVPCIGRQILNHCTTREAQLFVFQGLSATPCPQCRQRLAGAAGQTKLHHKQKYQSQNLKTQTRSFQDKGDRSAGVRTKGEVKGGGTEKTEKEKETEREREIAVSNHPLWVSIQAPTCMLPERASEGGSTLSTAHQGDQGRKPASCTLSVGLQPTVGTLTHTYNLYFICGSPTHRWDSYPHIHQYVEICLFSLFHTGLLLVSGK